MERVSTTSGHFRPSTDIYCLSAFSEECLADWSRRFRLLGGFAQLSANGMGCRSVTCIRFTGWGLYRGG
jgi:hypothetical protein